MLLYNTSRKQKWAGLYEFCPHLYLLFWFLLSQIHVVKEMASIPSRMWVKLYRKSGFFPPTYGFLIRGQCRARLCGCRAMPLSGGLLCLFLFYWCAQLFFFPLACAVLESHLLSSAYRIHRQKALRHRIIKTKSSCMCT